MFSAALFIIAKEWKQPKYPLKDDWIKKIYLSLYTGDLGLISGLGRSSGEGNGYPLQYSCLEKPVDRGAWHFSSWGSKEWDTTEQLTHTQ